MFANKPIPNQSSGPSCVPGQHLFDGLIAGWEFNENYTNEPAGTYVANNIIGTNPLVGVTATDTYSHIPGISGNAVEITGDQPGNLLREVTSSTFLNFDGSTDFSYNIWARVRNDRGGLGGRVNTSGSVTQLNHAIRVTPSQVQLLVSSTGSNLVGTSVGRQLNVWANYHFDYRASDQRIRAILNSNIAAANSGTASAPTMHISTQAYQIGRYRVDKTNADVDNYYVYGRLLDDCEIALLYNNGAGQGYVPPS